MWDDRPDTGRLAHVTVLPAIVLVVSSERLHAEGWPRILSGMMAHGDMTVQQFIAKWSGASLSERAASQEHFIDLCRLLGQPTPAEHDAAGSSASTARPSAARPCWVRMPALADIQHSPSSL